MTLHYARVLLALSLFPFFTACSNLKPVATFGTGASALAASYRPFVDGMEKTCLKTKAGETLLHTGPYDYKALQEKSVVECKPLADKKETALEFATVVDGYGAVLVELAGLKADALSADIGTLADTAAKLKTKGGDEIFNANALGAAGKLASGIVELVLGRKITKVSKEVLVEAQEPLAVTVGAMKTYVTRLYPSILTDYKNDTTRIEQFLVRESTYVLVPNDAVATAANRSRAVPYRLLQPQYRANMQEIAAEEDKIAKFGAASDALVLAHKELIDNFDAKTEPDKLAALKDFIKKARDLRNSINKI
jgi:hypothetical protein